KSENVPAALLLTGMEGVGKCFTAFQLVQVVNCRQAPPGDACGDCPDCRQIARRVHPDVLLVEAEKSQIKIDQIRELHHYLGFAPLSGRFKVVIINDAHLLNAAAANALLKTLEEPPAQTIFILVTHRQQVLLPTILSRCIALTFKPLSHAALRQIVVAGENDIDAKSMDRAIALGGGSVSMTRYFLEENRLAWRDDFLVRICALSAENYEDIFALADEINKDTENVEVAHYVLETFVRDALVLGNSSDINDLLLFHPDQLELLRKFAAKRTPEKLVFWLEELNRLQNRLLFNINIKLAWEALLLKLVVLQIKKG
ncbi:MAG: DNA polymerase III subunit delta', partial [Pseudomonadota bacterium]|nr:DNA polymerase III subunit delta' [Pseudomonadota bacterium]